MGKLQTLLSSETGNFAMENFKTLEKKTDEIDCDFEDAVRVVMESVHFCLQYFALGQAEQFNII